MLLVLVPTLRLLRSKLFSLLVVALVLGGYTEVLRGLCSHEPSVAAAAVESAAMETPHSHSHPDHQEGEACQCICHSSFVNEQSAKPFAPAVLALLSLVSERADRPPDSVPLGIDYPPQLA